MNNKIQWGIGVIAILALVLSLRGLVGNDNQPVSPVLGGVTNLDSLTLSEDLIVTDDATITDDFTVSGGTITLTTANTATSSLTVGCIQTTATSTETNVRFVLSSAGTTTATFGAGTANGGVSWQYGTCPI